MRPTTPRASLRSPGPRGVPGRLLAAGATVLATVLVTALAGCSDDASKAGADPSRTPSSAATSASPSPSSSASPAAQKPDKPTVPAFAPGDKGQKAFAEFVVARWGYALSTNDATAVTGLSPSKKEQCRGCKDLAAELKRRDNQGWHVNFPGTTVRRTTLEHEGDRILATTVADIPASQSFFDDGAFRNDNEAHRGAKFLIDSRIDGEAKRRHYVLLAFSLR